MKYDLENLEKREVLPGFVARFVHGDGVTLAFWEIHQGASLPEHEHVHEQVAYVIEGIFEMTVDGAEHVLRPGSVLTIPSGVKHAGRARTACRILDVFQPARDDYR